jgi:hypothetical protein
MTARARFAYSARYRTLIDEFIDQLPQRGVGSPAGPCHVPDDGRPCRVRAGDDPRAGPV